MENENYTECYVAFLDILGFKNLVIHKQFEDITSIFDVIYGIIEQLNHVKSVVFSPEQLQAVTVSVVSDTIILSIPKKIQCSLEVLLNFVCSLAGNLLYHHNVLLRGGIEEGNFYSGNGRIFGDSIIKAALLEKNVAIYPRIVVRPKLIESYIKDNKYDHIVKESLHTLLQKDLIVKDSFFIVNYILFWLCLYEKDNQTNNGAFNPHKFFGKISNYILSELLSLTDTHIREKYVYFADYYNLQVDYLKSYSLDWEKDIGFKVAKIDVLNVFNKYSEAARDDY